MAAIRDACDLHDPLPTNDAKFAWAKSEGEKLHMCWRYVWDNLRRSDGSRCFALGRLKACFLDVSGTQADEESATEVEDEEAEMPVVTDTDDEAEASHAEPSASGNVVTIENEEAAVIQKSPTRLRGRKLSAQVSLISIDSWPRSPPRRPPPSTFESPPSTRLRRKTRSDPPSPPPGPESTIYPPAAPSPSSFVLPPPAHVQMTPLPNWHEFI